MNDRFINISLKNISEYIDYYPVKDYILSNNIKEIKTLFRKHLVSVDGIAFILHIRGTCKLKMNSKVYEIKENTVLVVLPGSICELVESSDDSLCEYLFFSVDFIHDLTLPRNVDLFKRASTMPILYLTLEEFNCLLDFHGFMLKHYKRKNHLYKEYLLKNTLGSFLTEVCNIYNDFQDYKLDMNTRKSEIYQQFYKLLTENIKSNRTVQFYADKMCLSSKYFSQLIKSITGKTIIEWINEICINTIKIMLKTSPITVQQISEELNFPNPSFFCCYFKKHTGMTPMQYRKS